jgi:hypothetical protein
MKSVFIFTTLILLISLIKAEETPEKFETCVIGGGNLKLKN